MTSSFLASFPKTRTKARAPQTRNQWITFGIKKSRNTLHLLANESKKNFQLKQKYKTYRRVYLKVLKLAKLKSNRMRIIKATNRQREMWRVIIEIEDKKLKKIIISWMT